MAGATKTVRLAIIGNPGFIDRSFLLETEALYRRCGNNTGNLVFWYAFQTHVVAEEKNYFGFHFDPANVNKSDAVVFLFANHVNPGLDLGPMLEKLQDIKIPVIALGLGIQGEIDKPLQELTPGSIEYFSLLGEKADTIGVRGDLTKAALAQLGVPNTEVLGCVSNFITPKLQNQFRAFDPDRVSRILINNDFTNAALPVNQALATAFPDAIIDNVAQAPLELLRAARDEIGKIPDEYVSKMKSVLKPYADAGRSETAMLNNIHAFYDTRAWLEYSRGFDLAIGTRMHGNMVAHQAGVPTLFCIHDSRTAELCNTMAIPGIPTSAISESLRDSMYKIRDEQAVESYFAERAALAQRYRAFLENAGLICSPLLMSI